MDALTAIETRRVALQKELDDRKTQKERNRLGQFATPTLLASDVLEYVRTLLPERVPVRFLRSRYRHRLFLHCAAAPHPDRTD